MMVSGRSRVRVLTAGLGHGILICSGKDMLDLVYLGCKICIAMKYLNFPRDS